jgi:hypothetical protein
VLVWTGEGNGGKGGRRKGKKVSIHTSVNDLPTVQIRQAMKYTFSDFSQDFLARASAEFLDFAVYTVKRTTFAEFHGDGNGR